jgi:hypothetical protein
MDNYIFGGISGFCEVCITHPLDYYKVKLQQEKKINTNFYNFYNFYKNNLMNNGIRSLYKGFVPKVVGTIPMRVIFWGTQNHMNNICIRNNIKDYRRYLISGVSCGITQTLIDNPIEVMKIQLMTGAKNLNNIKYNNLFNGFKYTLFRNVIFSTSVCYGNMISKEQNKIYNFITTGTFAFMASVITQPFDYFKTESQKFNIPNISNKKILLNKEILLNKGILLNKKIFIGTYPRAMVSFINMGIGCVVFNFLENFFYNNQIFK